MSPTVTFRFEMLGHAAAARLALALGGREIRVPASRQGRTWDALVQAIGADAAARFCDYFQGERLYVSSSQRMRTEHNRRRAAEMRAQGKGWCEVAEVIGYSERGARKLLRKAPSRAAEALLAGLAELETTTPS